MNLHAETLAVRNLTPDVQTPSFDDRIRGDAAALGFAVAPAAGDRP